MIGVGRGDVLLPDPSLFGGLGEGLLLDDSEDLLQAVVPGERDGLPGAHLETVVLRGVVRRRDHDPGVEPEFPHGEVQAVGADQTHVHHVRALFGKAFYQAAVDVRGGEPHVPPHGDHLGLQELHEPTPDPEGHLFVELLGDDAADVVSFENLRIHRHRL